MEDVCMSLSVGISHFSSESPKERGGVQIRPCWYHHSHVHDQNDGLGEW